MVYEQNGIRTKWYWTQWYTDKMVYGQNGTDKMVAIFEINYNSSDFNTYLVATSHK